MSSQNKDEKTATPTPDEVAVLQAKVEALEKTVVSYEDENESLKEQVQKLTTEVTSSVTVRKKEPNRKPVPSKQFTVNKKKYKFRVAQFRHNGELIKAVDALADTELLKLIVEKYTPLVEEA